MRPAQKRGVTGSGFGHALLLLLIIFGLPVLFDRNRVEEPMAITVEILPVTGITNVKPSESQPDPAPKPEPKPEPPPEPPKPVPPVQAEKEPEKPQPKTQVDQAPPPPPPPPPAPKPEPKPEEKPQPPKPAEPKKPEPKPEPKKEEVKKPAEDDLMAVLKSVKETAQKQQDTKPAETKPDTPESPTDGSKKAVSNQYNPEAPLSMSEKDAIRSQIAKCWNVPAGAKDAHELIVVLRVQLEHDGSVVNVVLGDASKARYAADNFFRAAADSAIRAVRQCSPLQNLPPDKFSTWKDMELTFDPKEMLF